MSSSKFYHLTCAFLRICISVHLSLDMSFSYALSTCVCAKSKEKIQKNGETKVSTALSGKFFTPRLKAACAASVRVSAVISTLVCHSATTTCLLRCHTLLSHVSPADSLSFRITSLSCTAIVPLQNSLHPLSLSFAC